MKYSIKTEETGNSYRWDIKSGVKGNDWAVFCRICEGVSKVNHLPPDCKHQGYSSFKRRRKLKY
jgi:hypothetical protein